MSSDLLGSLALAGRSPHEPQSSLPRWLGLWLLFRAVVEVFSYGVLPHGLTLAFLPAATLLPHDTPREGSS